MSRPVCVVIGVGPGNGEAFARRFAAEGYAVALLSRSTGFTSALAGELEDALAYACDVTDLGALRATFSRIQEQLGPVQVLVYNAGSGVFKDPERSTAEDLELSWQINARGLLVAAQQVMPGMIERGEGQIVVVGATASLRGKPFTTVFASAKAAQRSLAQSLARHLGPKGVHVGLLILDGQVDLPRTRAAQPELADEVFLKPDDIALTAWNLTQQPRSAWSFEVDLRPFGESW
ncbi:MAG: SDR family NAD(P)-dependent oxidoreductase [Alphaproteobacteria bacterium]|nr:SDR family NAD(P)-dependent oxidoreductase [Alphaproteobacteria bacterium]